MKRLLLLLFMLPLFANSQLTVIPGYTNINQRYQWIGGIFRDVMHVPGISGFPISRTGAWVGDGELMIDTVGNKFYFKTNGVWRPLADTSYVRSIVGSGAWALTGNSGTNPSTNFIGTTDNVGIDIRTNNTIKHRFTTLGQFEFENTGNSVFIGKDAGDNDDQTNNRNVFVGGEAGRDNQTGDLSVAIGYQTLRVNTTGATNTAVGAQAMVANTTGTWNNSFGYQSMRNVTTGNDNVAVGYRSGFSLTTGHNLVAIGNDAGRFVTGSDNTVVGFGAGVGITTGERNVVIGSNSGAGILGGGNNLILDGSGSVSDLGPIDSTVIIRVATRDRLRFDSAGNLITLIQRYSSSNRLVPVVQDTVTGEYFRQTITGGGSGTVTSVAAGFGTSFSTITSTGSVIVDTTSGGVQSWVRGKKIIDSLHTQYVHLTGTETVVGAKTFSSTVTSNGDFFSDQTSNADARIGQVSTFPGIWLGANAASPSLSNYAFLYDSGSGTILNTPAGTNFYTRIGNVNVMAVTSTGGVSIGTTGYATNPGANNLGVEGKIHAGGNTTPTEALQVTGNIRFSGSVMGNYTAQTSTYTILASDYVVDCTTGTFTATLPSASGCAGRVYYVVNTGGGTITLSTTGGEFIGNTGTATSVVLASGISYQVISSGARWLLF